MTYLSFRRGFLVMLGGLSFNLVLALPDVVLREPLLSFLVVFSAVFWVLVNGVLLSQVRRGEPRSASGTETP